MKAVDSLVVWRLKSSRFGLARGATSAQYSRDWGNIHSIQTDLYAVPIKIMSKADRVVPQTIQKNYGSVIAKQRYKHKSCPKINLGSFETHESTAWSVLMLQLSRGWRHWAALSPGSGLFFFFSLIYEINFFFWSGFNWGKKISHEIFMNYELSLIAQQDK